MESIKLAILRRIQENMPDIRTIAEDYGQLEYPSDKYPIFFPAVFISVDETEWETIGIMSPLVQNGTRTVTLKLAFDCYHDTHAGSTTEHFIEQRETKAKELFSMVQNWRLKKGMSPFCRIKDKEYPLGGGVKVYAITFRGIDNTFER